LSEAMERLKAMEDRVAQLKDWKLKYEEDKGKWDQEKKELLRKTEGVEKLREAMVEFLNLDRASVPAGTSKAVLNLEHKELVVNLAHGEKEINLTTGTVIGKVLYCALTELDKEGFSQVDLSDALKDHGWNIPQTTLAPTLGRLVKDGNLVRVEGSKPMEYRLPGKVKLNVRLMELAKG